MSTDPSSSRPPGADPGAAELPRRVSALARELSDATTAEARRSLASALSELAQRAGEAGDLDTAQQALEAATAAMEWADLHCKLGVLLVQRGRTVEARAAFDRALALNPRYRTAVVERALLDAREGRMAQAMESLRVLADERAVAEPGAFRQGLEQLGRAEFEDAAELLRQALHDGDPWLEEQMRRYTELGFAGDATRAFAVLRDAAIERPGYADLQLLLGAHELQLGAVDDAIESITQALMLNPELHAARVQLARAFEALGDTPQAIAQLALVIEADPGHVEARELQARLAARRLGPRAGVAGA
jgi:tetratricopeptide (TPR) repeat protein